jgi:nicotinamide phosphoribosyltransferase
MKEQNLINNLILNTDSYKMSQWVQYPEGTEGIFSYIESRGCKFSDKIMMFGLTYFLKKYLSKPITQKDIDFAEVFAKSHGEPFNKKGWQHILDRHKGVLPLIIKAVPEGTVMPTKNVMVTVENTDPDCYWLTSYIETALLRSVWYPSTIATNSFLTKQIIKEYLDKTSDNPESEILFKLHDFGARGVNSLESAGIGGASHLVNFMGTDTISGVLTAMEYYDSDVCGFSIPASEHSCITAWGKEKEQDAYSNMIRQFGEDKGNIFAVVSDSYDIYNATKNIWAKHLLKYVEKNGSTVVIRPDSGDPTKVPVDIIKILMNEVGCTINKKGYKVLPDYVRVIQGDGITRETLKQILENLEAEKISATNITFGMGGGLLQQFDRDTFKFAMKCSSAKIYGIWKDVYKDPVTDKGKISKKGRLTLVKDEQTGKFRTIIHGQEIKPNEINMLKTVYNNGIKYDMLDNFETIRQTANNYL